MSSQHVDYVGGPMDGLREIKAGQACMPTLTDCYGHVYVRTQEEPHIAKHTGKGRWDETGRFIGIALPCPTEGEERR